MLGCQLQPSGGSAHLPLCRPHLYTEFPVPLSAAVMSSVLAELWQLGPAGVLPFSPHTQAWQQSSVCFTEQRSGLALFCGRCLGISPTAQKIFKVKIQHCLRWLLELSVLMMGRRLQVSIGTDHSPVLSTACCGENCRARLFHREMKALRMNTS